MSKTYGDLFDVDCDPAIGIILAILRQARDDAQKGDLAALSFLITEGADLSDNISEGTREAVLRFCRECWQKLDADKKQKFKYD